MLPDVRRIALREKKSKPFRELQRARQRLKLIGIVRRGTADRAGFGCECLAHG